MKNQYFISKYYLVSELATCDKNLIETIRQAKATLETEKTSLEASKNSLEEKVLIPKKEFVQAKPKAYKVESLFNMPETNLNENKPTYNSSNSFDNFNKPIHNNLLDELKNMSLENEDIVEVEICEEVKEIIEQPAEPVKYDKLPYFEYVGQAFGTYLIFQNDKELYLMDQHAAAERINYEKYYEILGNKNQPTTELLLPIMISFTKSEILAAFFFLYRGSHEYLLSYLILSKSSL